MGAALLLLALRLAAEPQAPPAAQPVRGDDPCAGLKVRFVESIASHGFLGVLTPDADGAVVREALEQIRAVDERFDWRQACSRARRAKLATFWVGCRGDSDEVESRHYGRLGEGGGQTLGRLKARCVVSAYRRRETPDWDELVEKRLLPIGSAERTIYPSSEEARGDRYDQLDDPKVRVQLYADALRDGFERFDLYGPTGRPAP